MILYIGQNFILFVLPKEIPKEQNSNEKQESNLYPWRMSNSYVGTTEPDHKQICHISIDKKDVSPTSLSTISFLNIFGRDNVHQIRGSKQNNFHHKEHLPLLNVYKSKRRMISLKCIQTSFTPTKHVLSQKRGIAKRKSILFLCKSNKPDSKAPPPGGDAKKQELLARIAMLQTKKVRLTDYIDERSSYLTQFAEEANAEFDQIGENALKELDETSARIMGNIESRMQALEESAESNKLELEKNEEKLAEFEGQIEDDRNEGLFFKNLGQKTPVEKGKAKDEIEKIRGLTKERTGIKTRRNIYLALIGLLIIGIVDSLVSSSSDWHKVPILGVILVGVLSQVIYEQSMLSETEPTQEAKTEEEKE